MRRARNAIRMYASAQKNFFGDLEYGAPDPVFGVFDLFMKDKTRNKVNLSLGVYRTEDGAPHVFRAVRKVEEELARFDCDKEYGPSGGEVSFNNLSKKLIFGNDQNLLDRVATVQSISGCGAISLTSQYLAERKEPQTVTLLTPTWDNHYVLFNKIAKIIGLEMYDTKTSGFRSNEVIEALRKTVPYGSTVVLQACAHNPTGVDPSERDWTEISKICKERHLLPIIDGAYLGFISGNISKDSTFIKILLEDKHEFFVCQSYSKIMGLYGERIGALHAVCNKKEDVAKLEGYFSTITQELAWRPGAYPSHIVSRILGTQEYYNDWMAELQEVTGRIRDMRVLLHKKMKELRTPGNWDFILSQKGLFSYAPLSVEQCDDMIMNKHVYILRSGRMCMAGFNKKNIGIIANAIHDVVTKKSQYMQCPAPIQ